MKVYYLHIYSTYYLYVNHYNNDASLNCFRYQYSIRFVFVSVYFVRLYSFLAECLLKVNIFVWVFLLNVTVNVTNRTSSNQMISQLSEKLTWISIICWAWDYDSRFVSWFSNSLLLPALYKSVGCISNSAISIALNSNEYWKYILFIV